jgi:hypothetical protein
VPQLARKEEFENFFEDLKKDFPLEFKELCKALKENQSLI